MLAVIFSELKIALNSKYAAQKQNCVLQVDYSSTHRIDGCKVKVLCTLSTLVYPMYRFVYFSL